MAHLTDDTQVNTDDEMKQNLRARNCTKPNQDLPTHFQAIRNTVSFKDEVGIDVVGSLGRHRDQTPLEVSNVSLSTQAPFAAKGFVIKNEPLENDKAVGTEVKCKDDSFDDERTTLRRTGFDSEAQTQLQLRVQDFKSIAIKNTK